MTKIVLSSYKAQYSAGAVQDAALIFDFDPPLAKRVVEVQGLAGVQVALDSYLADLKALGVPAAAMVGLAAGERSPNKFNKTYNSFFAVNIPKP